MYKKCVSRQSVGIWGYDRRTRLESIDFTSRTEQSSRKDGEEGVGVVGPRSGSNNADFDEEESTTMLLLGSPNGIPCKIRDSPRVSTRRPRTRSWNPWTKETSLRSLCSVSARPGPRSISNRGSRSHENIIFFERPSGKVFGSSGEQTNFYITTRISLQLRKRVNTSLTFRKME